MKRRSVSKPDAREGRVAGVAAGADVPRANPHPSPAPVILSAAKRSRRIFQPLSRTMSILPHPRLPLACHCEPVTDITDVGYALRVQSVLFSAPISGKSAPSPPRGDLRLRCRGWRPLTARAHPPKPSRGPGRIRTRLRHLRRDGYQPSARFHPDPHKNNGRIRTLFRIRIRPFVTLFVSCAETRSPAIPNSELLSGSPHRRT